MRAGRRRQATFVHSPRNWRRWLSNRRSTWSEHITPLLDLLHNSDSTLEKQLALLDALIASPHAELRGLVAGLRRVAELRTSPLELSLTTTAGETIDLAALRGRVVLVDFWSISCSSCIGAMPGLKQIHDRYRSAAVWPTAFVEIGPTFGQSPLQTRFSIIGVPLYLLLDQSGRLVGTNYLWQRPRPARAGRPILARRPTPRRRCRHPPFLANLGGLSVNCFSRMKRASLLAVFASLALGASAQVACSLAVKLPAGPAIGAKACAVLTVEIEEGWHISSLTQPDGGPLRTEIKVPDKQFARLAGKIIAPAPRKQHNAAFDLVVETYEETVEFKLPLETTESLPPGARLRVEITYQACTEDNCLMPRTASVEATVASAARQ